MNRKDLVKTLELLKPALADNALVAVFQCYQFTGKNVIAFNDDLGIVTPCKTDIPFAVNGEVLLGLINNCSSEEVSLDPTINDEGNELIVKAGRSTFRLPYFSEEEFLFEEPNDKWDEHIPIEWHLCDALTSCITTVSSDTSRPALMGVCLRGSLGKLYSCDGDRVTRVDTKMLSTQMGEGTYVIPISFCEAILKIMEATEARAGSLFLNNEWAKAITDSGYTLYGRLIELDNDLDHEGLIEATLKTEPVFTKIPEGLDSALARAIVVTKNETAKTVLTVENKRLKIVTESPLGIVRDSIAFDGPDVQANVLAEHLQKLLPLSDEICIQENCVALRNQDAGLFQLVSNLGT